LLVVPPVSEGSRRARCGRRRLGPPPLGGARRENACYHLQALWQLVIARTIRGPGRPAAV